MLIFYNSNFGRSSTKTRPNNSISTFEWDAINDTYSNLAQTELGKPWSKMRGCLVNSNGEVNYYLNPNDWTQKADGGASDLTGTDGNVMIEIPRFYFRQDRIGDVVGLGVSEYPLEGLSVHPAFLRNNNEKPYRYFSAYDVCTYDQSAGSYIGGLNLDDNSGNVDLSQDVLASVKGQFPMVGLTRAEFRQLAQNLGTGWSLGSFWTVSAIQMLYLCEFQNFNGQLTLGDGNTNGSYTGSSADQNDSPHTVAGAGDSWGSGSTDGSQPSSGSKPGTAYMKYRGIENFFGNCWNFTDGVNSLDRQFYVSNNTVDFQDDTLSNYQKFGVPTPDAFGDFVTDIQDVQGAFIPASVGGGSSTTYIADAYYEKTGWRVLLFGWGALNGSQAGPFFWSASDSSYARLRSFGARIEI